MPFLNSRTSLAWMCLLASLLGRMAAAAPINDNLNNATLLVGTNLTVTGSNLESTKEIGEPNHAANLGGRSIWWTWSAPDTGSATLSTGGSSFDTLLAVYTGSSFSTLNSVVANDDNGSKGTSAVSFNVIRDTVYKIAVDGYNGATGQVQLAVMFLPQTLTRAINDGFTNRLSLAGATVQTGSANCFATKESGEPNHGNELGGASVWWTWTAPTDGLTVIETEGSSFDTLLGVYTGAVLTNLVLVAQNDDISTNQPTSRVSFRASARTSYQIAVDGFNGDLGMIVLQISMGDVVWLSPPKPSGTGGFTITLMAPVGKPFTLEATSDLVRWEPVQTLVSADGLIEFNDPAGHTSRRFYRAQQAR